MFDVDGEIEITDCCGDVYLKTTHLSVSGKADLKIESSIVTFNEP